MSSTYLQITSICNMSCAHCGLNCGPRGIHMPFSKVVDAVGIARSINDEVVVLGGGEPTLHPHFWAILKLCLDRFDSVWLATNGSQTTTMWELSDLLDNGRIEPEGGIPDDEDWDWKYGIYQEEQLLVALSQDNYHAKIDPRVIVYWEHRAKTNPQEYEVRRVDQGFVPLSRNGRAKINQLWADDHCICDSLIFKPSGNIKLCGCDNSPIIGNTTTGLDPQWLKYIESEEHLDNPCYRALHRRMGPKRTRR